MYVIIHACKADTLGPRHFVHYNYIAMVSFMEGRVMPSFKLEDNSNNWYHYTVFYVIPCL